MKTLKILTIVIPTFNRKKDICKNILLLNECIEKKQLQDKIKIIVSDNHSEDGTYEELLKIKKIINADLECIEQKENIGGTNNSRAILRNCLTPYVMLLGDDDYLHDNYLPTVINYIESNNDITAIIPNFYTNRSVNCRDSICEDKLYKKGTKYLELMFKAHQMSGLVFKTEGVMNTLYTRKGENEYYQVFCIGYNILRGTTVHITRYPVCVNTTNSKYWSYGKNGLWDDMFLNIRLLRLPMSVRKKLERYYLINYSWTYAIRFIQHPVNFCKSIISLNNMTNSTKIIAIPLLFYSVLRIIYQKKIKKVGKNNSSLVELK